MKIYNEEFVQKVCITCNESKALDDFYRVSIKDNTKRSVCKSCMNSYKKRYMNINKHKEKIYRDTKKYKKSINAPWERFFYYINSRMKRSTKEIKFKYYINIKNFLTKDDLKEMWFQDKAYLMNKPSLDRIDPDKDYTRENTRFLELSENTRRIRKNPTEKSRKQSRINLMNWARNNPPWNKGMRTNIKECLRCHKSFNGRHCNSKFCSKRCAMLGNIRASKRMLEAVKKG